MTNNIDDASLWWQSRHSEVQDYEEPEIDNSFVNLDDDKLVEHVTDKDVKTQLNLAKINEPTAKILITLIDTVVPLLVVLVLKQSAKEDIKLTEDESETLISACALWLKDINFEMSPGYVFAGTLVTIYGSKIILEVQKNKQKQNELEIMKQQVAAVQQQNEFIKQALEIHAEKELKNKTDEQLQTENRT